ncbi:hypothetical protein ACFFQF_00920 [Haladaptatus pallidirubidus]|uniref:Uncharacterized protein n=1 Tax=Haladaptatus pallidirubidus TaxID=1008152 RepID=A0AAV3UBU1_9EURY|nr:hypothetical protein [Haladaptatus pallidirubidus]
MPRKTETIDLREEFDKIDSELDEIAYEVAKTNAEYDEDETTEQEEATLARELNGLLDRRDQLERELAGVQWAIDQWGAETPTAAETWNEWDKQAWLDQNYETRAQYVRDGRVDDFLDKIEAVETSQNVKDAVESRRSNRIDDDSVTITIGALTTGEFADVQDRTESLRNQMVGMGDDPVVQGAGSIYRTAAGLIDAPPIDADTDLPQKTAVIRETPPHFKEWLEGRVSEFSTPDVDVGNFNERLQRAQEDLETT